MSAYAKLFQDPRWQRKRLEIFERDEFKCTQCGEAERPLHVHHLYYCRGRAPWEYPSFALESRCEDCHDRDSQTLRHDDGTYFPTEWEIVLQALSNGNPSHFTSRHGLLELAEFFAGLVESGVPYSEALATLSERLSLEKQLL